MLVIKTTIHEHIQITRDSISIMNEALIIFLNNENEKVNFILNFENSINTINWIIDVANEPITKDQYENPINAKGTVIRNGDITLISLRKNNFLNSNLRRKIAMKIEDNEANGIWNEDINKTASYPVLPIK